MFTLSVMAITFGLIFVAELPDKTAVAGLVLGTRFPALWVFTGMAAAFLTHVAIAVAAGSLLTLLPRRPVELIVAALFLLGAVLVWREGLDTDNEDDGVTDVAETAGFWRVASLGYGVIFLSEWGDLTQILTANLAAKYDDPLSVAIGTTLSLWAVALLAIFGGKTLLAVLPLKWITRIAAAVHGRARHLQPRDRHQKLRTPPQARSDCLTKRLTLTGPTGRMLAGIFDSLAEYNT